MTSRNCKFLLIPELFVSFLIFCVLVGCANHDDPSKENSSSAGFISIVAAENFYGEAALHVGGSHVHVESILSGSSADPHSFEATLATARSVHDADIVIYNGLGYDDWMEKLIQSHSPVIIEVGRDIANKQDGDNEHVWYMPDTMTELALKLADHLSEMDPDHADDYRRNAESYAQSFAPLKNRIQTLIQMDALPVAVTEPVFDYMLEAMNMVPAYPDFAQAMEEGVDPSPSVLARMQNDIKEGQIAFLVVNEQIDSTTIRNLVDLAVKNGIPIVKVSETKPPDKSTAQWMIDQLEQIEQIMSGKKE